MRLQKIVCPLKADVNLQGIRLDRSAAENKQVYQRNCKWGQVLSPYGNANISEWEGELLICSNRGNNISSLRHTDLNVWL